MLAGSCEHLNLRPQPKDAEKSGHGAVSTERNRRERAFALASLSRARRAISSDPGLSSDLRHDCLFCAQHWIGRVVIVFRAIGCSIGARTPTAETKCCQRSVALMKSSAVRCHMMES